LVYVVPIEGVIDLGLAPFLDRTIRDAEQTGAAAVVLDINTFGGRVDAAVVMRDALLQARIRTIAFVNPRAISAGALLALATETIVMTEGGTIGAAMPVISGGAKPQAADEKSVSYLRKEFAATAERRGRPAEFAEAMVDVDVEIPGAVEKGKLLTLTASEAIAHHVVEFTADTLETALDVVGLGDADVRRTSQTWAETLVRFLTNPMVASLLMTIGLLGLLVEFRTPGFGVAGVVGLLSFAVLFWGHWLVQLAGWEELLLVGAGTLLIRSRGVRDSRLRSCGHRRGSRSRGGARHDPCGSWRDVLDSHWGTRARGDLTAARPRRRARIDARTAAPSVRPPVRAQREHERRSGIRLGAGYRSLVAGLDRNRSVAAAAGGDRRDRGDAP
jgi:membrane-bound serine protease (ClpP class)